MLGIIMRYAALFILFSQCFASEVEIEAISTTRNKDELTVVLSLKNDSEKPIYTERDFRLYETKSDIAANEEGRFGGYRTSEKICDLAQEKVATIKPKDYLIRKIVIPIKDNTENIRLSLKYTYNPENMGSLPRPELKTGEIVIQETPNQ
jgi:hypothetical protein